jgi:two-component system KDP operon response regulator KdpE
VHARVKTALRHAKANEATDGAPHQSRFQLGELTVDYDKRRVLLGGRDVHLTQIEYRIVELLSRNSGRVMTYDVLMKRVWGPNTAQDHQVLRVNMANIRRKLEANPAAPQFIRTEIGVGYWMAEGE